MTPTTATDALTEALRDLSEPFDVDTLPHLDDPSTDDRALTMAQRWWRDNGYVILRGLVPEPLVAAYEQAWLRAHAKPVEVAEAAEPIDWIVDTERAGGWDHATPYMECAELRDLGCCAPLAEVLQHLIGEPMGMHLNLTGWVSTRRDWHQDGYLNPDHVADWYAAAWIALGDVDDDAGPFEYVPGSHRWPIIRQAKMLDALGEPPGGLDGQWPKRSERLLTPIFTEHLEREGIVPERFGAKRGDVLVWHARLLHRGSVPRDPTLERRALIVHYSGITHRPDMPAPTQHPGGGWFFPITHKTSVR